ncbi:hypothetical protein FXW07_14490 [Methanosarcina sp. DH1]|uniref:hypothetical protein n=1 Tax=Methanosarcina sp. DH1 TaxID=2605695 RepID=UPI001E2B198D|nr:hypothetical protein [Methanosarcina sp. DH1]MCC4767775.1 hypothetical protein [Methanosarcina sp. DH1]
MINFVDLSILIILLISTTTSVFIFKAIQYKKSFFQINEELSNSKVTETSKIKMLENLHDDLGNKNDEQIIINNFYFKNKNVWYWYNILLIVAIPALIYIAVKYVSKDIQVYIVFFSLSIIISVLLIGYYFARKLLGKVSIKLRNIVQIIFSITIENIYITFTSLTIFLILLNLYLLVLTTLVDKNITFQLFNTLSSSINSYQILESTSDIQLSLSTLFFSLAIGGTVIFSTTHYYLNQRREIENELSTQVNRYLKWHKENESVLYLNIADSLKGDKINKFYDALIELRSSLNVYNIKERKIPTQRYERFIGLIIISYFGGIFAIIVPSDLMNFTFLLFCGITCVYIWLTYLIFRDTRA